ncbi:MAG: multifunctional CCA addition/repair protein [Betaproteobacteria bacterium]
MARPLPQPARIYEVGGAIRDGLLGRPNADRDYVVVGVTPETMLASGFRPVGRDFPVFLHPETNEEYALARTERKHGRGYRGFEFFASPDVTLEEDLARRDLTINAMARGDDGRIIDPYGGQADLAARVLRHVSTAFVEDPLRVLRVARFAARLGFTVAPETEALMRSIVASGELSTLAPERVWQELAKGLAEPRPSQMLAVLRQCGALANLLPEVNAMFGVARVSSPPEGVIEPRVPDAGVLMARTLDWAADHGATLAARYAILLHDLGTSKVTREALRLPQASTLRSIRVVERVSARLKVPLECQDAARLAAQLWRKVNGAATLTPAGLLDLINATDALRRPVRLETLLVACAAIASSWPGVPQDYPAAALLREALAVVKSVDAGAVARMAGIGKSAPNSADAVASAVRAARLKALRAWRRNRA